MQNVKNDDGFDINVLFISVLSILLAKKCWFINVLFSKQFVEIQIHYRYSALLWYSVWRSYGQRHAKRDLQTFHIVWTKISPQNDVENTYT